MFCCDWHVDKSYADTIEGLTLLDVNSLICSLISLPLSDQCGEGWKNNKRAVGTVRKQKWITYSAPEKRAEMLKLNVVSGESESVTSNIKENREKPLAGLSDRRKLRK